MAATQGSIQSRAFDDKTTGAAWQTRPSWYVVSANDRMIPPDLERAMAKKTGAIAGSRPSKVGWCLPNSERKTFGERSTEIEDAGRAA